MPQFKCKAVRDGKEYSGVEEASDKFALYKSFQTRGETIVSAKEIKKSSNFFHTFSISFGGIKTPDKIMFAKKATLLYQQRNNIHHFHFLFQNIFLFWVVSKCTIKLHLLGI